MLRRIDGPMPDPSARRILAEEVVALQVLRGPYRPRDESPTAVRADVLQHVIDAGRTECALVAADARFGRVGRQGLVAVLAGGSKLEHSVSLSVAANVWVRYEAGIRPS